MTASSLQDQCAGPPSALRRAVRVALAAILPLAWLAVAVATASAQSDAEITFINAIPGVSLDVYADGDPLAEGVEYGDQYDISETAGLAVDEFELRESGSSSAFLRAEGEIADTGNWTMVAHLEEDGQERVSLFNNDVDPVDAGKGRLTIRHVANAGPLDIYLDSTKINPTSSGPLESGKQLSSDIAANDYVLSVLSEQSQDPLFEDQDITVVEGESLIVYIVGVPDDHDTVDQFIVLDQDTDPEPTETPEPEPTTEESTPTPTPTPPEEIMTDDDDVDSTPPASVDTGIGMMTVTRFSPVRTAGLVSIGLFGLAAVVTVWRRRQSQA